MAIQTAHTMIKRGWSMLTRGFPLQAHFRIGVQSSQRQESIYIFIPVIGGGNCIYFSVSDYL